MVAVVLGRTGIRIIMRHFLPRGFEDRPDHPGFKNNPLRRAAALIVLRGQAREHEVSFQRFVGQIPQPGMKFPQSQRLVIDDYGIR